MADLEDMSITDFATSTEAIPCVLIVDDDPEAGALFRDLIREQLDPRAQVLETSNGWTALQMAENHRVDVAIIDFQLPDINGLEVINRLKRTKSDPATLLVTGVGSETIAAQAFKRGAKDYIVKADLHHAKFGRRIRAAIASQLSERQSLELANRTNQNHADADHLVRALSHDMNANFMLLTHSFRRLQQSIESIATPTVQDNMDYLDACLTQSQRFLDDLITLGKTGDVDMQSERVNLTKLARAVRYEQQDLLAERGVQFHVAIDLPQLWCNHDRLKQIVTNLVRNAARHGCDPAQPRITIYGGQTSDNSAMAWFHVADNGPGIPAEDRKTIFKPGTRLASAHAEGSGMGLAIVERLAQRMGGSVGVSNGVVDYSMGTVFEVHLPAPAASVTTSDDVSVDAPVDATVDDTVDSAKRSDLRFDNLKNDKFQPGGNAGGGPKHRKDSSPKGPSRRR